MPKDYSPFTPGQPVPEEFFVGRRAEVERLLAMTEAATVGRLKVAYLAGERGIGKSSLASIVRFIATRQKGLLGLHTFMGGVSSLDEMVRRVVDRLLKESADKSWFGHVTDLFGKHVKEVGLFGVNFELDVPSQVLTLLAHDFVQTLRDLTSRLKDDRTGLFVVLDDINGLASSREFANWVKSLVDDIATSGSPIPLCLLLVGLEERRQSLISLQPSLARVFELVDIRTWNSEDTRRFFENAFAKVKVPIDERARDLLVQFAGGLPVLAHEIGDAVFKSDTDNRIDEADASEGILAAADVVGRKHLEPQVFAAIRSERYRGILRKLAMPDPVEMTFKRADLLGQLSNEEARVLDNFLGKMKDLNVLKAHPEGGRGTYQFSNQLHRLYFFMEAQRARSAPEPTT